MKNKIVSHYEILDKLGCGGMGEIYKAKDLKLNRVVALKFLSPAHHFDPLIRKRLLNEAKTAALLDHKNIYTIYEVNETDDGQIFLAMAYYEGETLREKLNKGKIDYKKSIEIIIQVSDGLLKAHEKNIVHRDIKPDNIFITNDGLVKILDFGIAKAVDQTQITKINATPGTVSYMSPEQIRGDEIDNTTDIWSLGIVFYELLTGQKPFKGESDPAIIYSILDEEPLELKYLNKNLPADLQIIVSKLICKDKSQRYQSLFELIKELNLILGRKFTFRQKLSYNKNLIKRYTIALGILLLMAMLYSNFNYMLLKEVDPQSKKIPIAIISFENQTGDTSHNYLQNVIPNLLITGLEQSNYFDITSWERLNDLEKQIHSRNFDFLDKELGFELCKKDNVDLMILGSYTKARSKFITDVKVIKVSDKKLLTGFTAKGDGTESILNDQIDEITKEISLNLGLLKIGDISKLKPISEVTTKSLEAYNFYLRGKEAFEALNWEDSKNLLLKAIEKDSTFAVAYAYLGIDYSYLHNSKKMNEVMKKALDLSQKVNEKEKRIIQAQYAILVESDINKYIDIYEYLENLYPQEKWFHICLGYGYSKTGRLQEAMLQWEKILRLDPYNHNTLNQPGYANVELGDYEKAFYYFDKLIEACPAKPNPPDSMGDLFLLMGNIEKSFYYYSKAYELSHEFGTQIKIAYLFALQQNFAEAIRWVDRRIKSAPSDGEKSIAYFWEGFYYYLLADFQNAYKNFAYAEMLAKRVNSNDALNNIYYLLSWLELENKSFNSSKKNFYNWIRLQQSTKKDLTHAIKLDSLIYNSWFALISDSLDEENKKLAEMKELIKVVSGHDSVRLNNLIKTFNAKLLYSQNLFQNGLELKREIYQPEISIDFRLIKYNLPTQIDITAKCYEILGDIDKAIKEYENISYYNPQKKEIRIVNPINHYRLGMLYERKGLKDKAIKEYQFYLKIYKNFDVEIPSLIDTKKRLLNLNGNKIGV